MNKEELRILCAKEALKHVENDSIIGLGAGRTISCLIKLIEEEKDNLHIKVVTPSDKTKKLCIEAGIEVIPTFLADKIKTAFDGCGEVDSNFYASKGFGGVFTKEKIIASMAEEYILLIDEEKLMDKLNSDIIVSVEVIRDAASYVCRCIKNLGGIPNIRETSNKDGYIITDDGNFLIDIKFEAVDDFKLLNEKLKSITGIVETSIFTKEAAKLIVSYEDGSVKTISK